MEIKDSPVLFEAYMRNLIAKMRNHAPEDAADIGKELFEALETMEHMRGHTRERQLNLAALSIIGGMERFMRHFMRVRACEACCPESDIRKMTALAMIAHAIDPTYGTEEGWLHPPHTSHVHISKDPNAENAPDVTIFILGSAYYAAGDDFLKKAPIMQAAWDFVTKINNPVIEEWYWVFFDSKPFEYQEYAKAA